MKKANNFQIAKVHRQGVASLLINFFANFSMALLIKVLLKKKRVFGKVFLINLKFFLIDFSIYSREQCKQNKYLKRNKRLLFLILSLEIFGIPNTIAAKKSVFSLRTALNEVCVISFFKAF